MTPHRTPTPSKASVFDQAEPAAKFPHATVPCAECPWRRDVPVGKFPPERYRVLAPTAYDMGATVFACHMSKDAQPFACAGFLLRSSLHNLAIRMTRQSFDHVRSPYPLFATYRAMAIANGVSPRDPALRNCRDDGARPDCTGKQPERSAR